MYNDGNLSLTLSSTSNLGTQLYNVNLTVYTSSEQGQQTYTATSNVCLSADEFHEIQAITTAALQVTFFVDKSFVNVSDAVSLGSGNSITASAGGWSGGAYGTTESYKIPEQFGKEVTTDKEGNCLYISSNDDVCVFVKSVAIGGDAQWKYHTSFPVSSKHISVNSMKDELYVSTNEKSVARRYG